MDPSTRSEHLGERSKAQAARRAIACLLTMAPMLAACGTKEAPPSPPCDRECMDGVALRGLRETMKLAYNSTVQNSPVGPQDHVTTSFLSGSAHVFGTATANALLGTTAVELTYVFSNAQYLRKDDTPAQNFDVTIDGVVVQKGIIAAQPTSTTALLMCGVVRIAGQVYDPPLGYEMGLDDDASPNACASLDAGVTLDAGEWPDAGEPVDAGESLDAGEPVDAGESLDAGVARCAVAFTQNGSDVGGKLCGRSAGFRF
jgi:hypothetical protein